METSEEVYEISQQIVQQPLAIETVVVESKEDKVISLIKI